MTEGNFQILGNLSERAEKLFSREALEFVREIHENFNEKRKSLLSERQTRTESGNPPNFLEDTCDIRELEWYVADAPKDLQDRRVEITGPVERKMMINALNSGAKVFMADFEDSLSPTWENISEGQVNLYDAVRRQLEFTNPNGKEYRLNDTIATLVVRARGWHLEEKHITFNHQPTAGAFLDFGLYFFHNAKELIERGSGPYFYLPKMESRKEAALWTDIFRFAEDRLKVPRGTIRATVLIETLPAAFQMEEILYELREYAAGLNAGRWDYIFSMIKTLSKNSDHILPDRDLITMTVPFMRAYTELLVKTCHKRRAHAMGGMSAFIPSRKDAEVNERALKKVREDKEREADDGFDGTWVAHPDLVSVAREAFDRKFGERPNQKERLRSEVEVEQKDLINTTVPDGKITERGVRHNIDVALQYLNAWLQGTGAAAIYNLMEDAATAEISRAELWHWVYHRVKLDSGEEVTPELYEKIRDEELEKLGGVQSGRLADAVRLLDQMVLSREIADFLTLPAYEILEQPTQPGGQSDEERPGLRKDMERDAEDRKRTMEGR